MRRAPLEAPALGQAFLPCHQLQQAAHSARDGQALAVPAARELARQAAQAALQSQAEAAKQKRRPAGAPTATSSPGTRGVSPGPS